MINATICSAKKLLVLVRSMYNYNKINIKIYIKKRIKVCASLPSIQNAEIMTWDVEFRYARGQITHAPGQITSNFTLQNYHEDV